MLAIAAAAVLRPRAGLAGDNMSVPRKLFSAAENDFAAVGKFHEFGDGDYVFDYARDRAGRLKPAARDGFELLSTFDDTGAPAARVAFTPDGLDLEGRNLKSVPIRRKAFTARNGDIALSAEIAAREDRPPVGTILLIYGSGPAPKEALDLWAFHFLARGWSVVTYDKRGSGRSAGDWRLAGLEALAADAHAVIAAAHSTAHLSRPFGVWGASQAGWIMPQLGARGSVDFIVMHAGAATTPAQQILDQVEAELTAYGFPREEIERALAYYALDTDVSRGRAPWSAIDQAYAQASAAKAEWLLGPPAAADAPERTFIRLVADFDPAPYWRRSRVPLLAIFGGKDVIVPAKRSQPLLKSLVPSGTRVTDIVLPNANHLGMVADTGVRAEYAHRTAIDPGYFPAIDAWLRPR